jgi:hypothetical protein
MSTRSSIAVESADGKVSAVYCHFDGYLSGVGAALLEKHNTQEAAEALVALGDLSTVADSVKAYHRDRGEEWEDVKPHQYANRVEYFERVAKEIGDNGYRYLFADGAWHIWRRRGREELETVSAALARNADEDD